MATRRSLYERKSMRRLAVTGGLDHRDVLKDIPLFQEVFPEVADELEQANEEIMTANCSNCAARRKLRPIIRRMSSLAKDRDISRLSAVLDKDKLAALAGLVQVKPSKPPKQLEPESGYKESESSMDPLDAASPDFAVPGIRPACMDCVNKHIAQAIILLQESKLGYPRHRWLAVGHLAEASEEALGANPILAAEIRSARLTVMAGGDPPLEDLLPED